MNYLAHVFLADEAPLSVLGNLMGDFVKGRDRLALLPADLQRGVLLHRHIDSFTDHHPLVNRAIRRINARWGWYSGIIIDVYFDHLLAIHWDEYSEIPLRPFCEYIHELIYSHLDYLDDEMREMGLALIANDRLMSYLTLQGIEHALHHISLMLHLRMPKKTVHLQDAIPELQLHHQDLSTDFAEFFPELIAFSKAKTRELGGLAVHP